MAVDDRKPPYDLDAEEAVVGSCLIDSEAVAKVMWLATDDFYRDKNQWVWGAILAVNKRREAVNQITVAHELEMMDRLTNIGGSAYLSNTVYNVPTSVHVEYYAQIVKKLADMRRLIDTAEDIADIGYNTPESSDDAYGQAMDKLLKSRGHTLKGGLQILGDAAMEKADDFMGWIDTGYQPTGLLTGFSRLDKVLGGLHGGDLTLLAARPAMGKTTFALNVARNLALRGISSALFSLEMNTFQLVLKLVYMTSKVDSQELRGDNPPEVASKLESAWAEVAGLPIMIDPTPSLKVTTAQARSMQAKATNDIKLIIFDHLGLAGDYGKNRVEKITNVSGNLKAMAKLTDLPVLALCQLSRAQRERDNKRPILEDLRDSGSLEQDADNVIGLYRHEYYYPYGDKKYVEEAENFLEALVLKQRMGKSNPRGSTKVGLYYDVKTGVMGNWFQEYPKLK